MTGEEPEMAQVVFIEPTDEESLRPLAVVLEVDGEEMLVAMAHPDIHLAGHLDIVVAASDTLAYSIAVFTHVVAWVPRCRVAMTAGSVPDSIVEMTHSARGGVEPPVAMQGFPLADPVMEPRWASIQNLVQEWRAGMA
jgi:hypothetical protein